MESLPGYDAWLTTPPEDRWGFCPTCGTAQEEAVEVTTGVWECQRCGYTGDYWDDDWDDDEE